MDDRVFTPQELIDRWQCSEDWLYMKLRSGEIPAFRIGKKWRVKGKTVEAFEDGAFSCTP